MENFLSTHFDFNFMMLLLGKKVIRTQSILKAISSYLSNNLMKK